MTTKRLSHTVSPPPDVRSQIKPQLAVLSSSGSAFKRVVVEHAVDLSREAHEVNCPDYLIALHRGQPAALERAAEGRTRRELFTEGDVIAINPPGFYAKPRWESRAEFIMLALDAACVTSAAEEEAGRGGRIEIVPSFKRHDPLIDAIAQALLTEVEAGYVGGRLYSESLINTLTLHIARRYSVAPTNGWGCSGGLPPRRLRRATEYIHEHLADDVALTHLAAAVGVNPYYFARTFKQSTGITPHQYVIRERIERAKRLLAVTDLTVLEISLRVGFASQSHFAKLFRRAVGVAPATYRGMC